MYEIERKFLLADAKSDKEWRPHVLKTQEITQGYFDVEGATVRVRIVDGEGFLTVKGAPREGEFKRLEFEYSVPVEDAEEMLGAFCGERMIEKRRHHLAAAGSHWIIDEFSGKHEGLLLAEIELESEDEVFEKPDWLGKEVTEEKEYTNSHLSTHSGVPG